MSNKPPPYNENFNPGDPSGYFFSASAPPLEPVASFPQTPVGFPETPVSFPQTPGMYPVIPDPHYPTQYSPGHPQSNYGSLQNNMPVQNLGSSHVVPPSTLEQQVLLQAGQPQTTLVILQPPTPQRVIATPKLPKSRARITCPSCHQVITTKVDYQSTAKTHLVALCLFMFLCWCCCCIPYCTSSCRKAAHSCPKCRAYIGNA